MKWWISTFKGFLCELGIICVRFKSTETQQISYAPTQYGNEHSSGSGDEPVGSHSQPSTMLDRQCVWYQVTVQKLKCTFLCRAAWSGVWEPNLADFYNTTNNPEQPRQGTTVPQQWCRSAPYRRPDFWFVMHAVLYGPKLGSWPLTCWPRCQDQHPGQPEHSSAGLTACPLNMDDSVSHSVLLFFTSEIRQCFRWGPAVCFGWNGSQVK